MKHAAFLTTILGFLVTISLVSAFRRFAFRWQLIDFPNDRSSHILPTPSAGGIGIVISFFAGMIFLYWVGLYDSTILASFLIGGFLLAGVGFVDDWKHVPIKIRFLMHIIAAASVLYLMGGMPPLDLGFGIWYWNRAGITVGLLGLVWLINLYNFMDGIDGLAASEAVFVSLAIALLLFLKGEFSHIPLLLLLASAVAGFLVLNWSPARVFMGDTGSGFLGFIFGVLLLVTTGQDHLTPWQWLILLGCFWVDATITLLFRVTRGEPWYAAHCTHAFQQAVKKTGCHKQVVMRVQLINIFWLLPMSLLTLYYPKWVVLITTIAILPLVFICLFLKAGVTELLPSSSCTQNFKDK